MRALWLFVGVVAYILLGGMMFAYLEDWSYAEGCYFSTVTMTTVGYGDLWPTRPGSKVAAVLYATLGFVAITSELVWLITKIKDVAARQVQLVMLACEETPRGGEEPPPIAENWGVWRKSLAWGTIFFGLQLASSGVYCAIVPGLAYSDAVFNAFIASLTVGYGMIAGQVGDSASPLAPIQPYRPDSAPLNPRPRPLPRRSRRRLRTASSPRFTSSSA